MDDTERVWLVERSLDDGRIITLTYASADGTAVLTRQQAVMSMSSGVPVSIEVDQEELSEVDEPEQQDMYRSEVARMRNRHTPGDRV